MALVMAVGVGNSGVTAQKSKPPAIQGGPSDAVFADLGEPGAAGSDRIRSDGYTTVACSNGAPGEASRYCGGTFTDPETGLTYDGVGPECSRISSGTKGDYAYRTISSKCAVYPPLADAGQRRLVLDFGGHLGVARCQDTDPSNDTIARTVDGLTRSLNVCGTNSIDDVRLIAGEMFAGSSSGVTVYISLHAPPLANTTQFLLEFAQPASVINNGGSRTLFAAPGQARAVLWEVELTRSGRLQKASSPIGEYSMPFSLTARTAPMQ